MVDSEDEFTQLCSKLLKRVKKTRPLESRDVPRSSTAARNKLRKTKPSVSKSQSGNDDIKTAEQGTTSGSDHEKPAERHETSDCDGAFSRTRGLQTQVDHPSDLQTQRGRAGTETLRSQDHQSVTHKVLERMQQFKRAGPSRMKLSSTDEGGPELADPPESDGAVSSALQMDLDQQHCSLEDQGLFFCQLCQKDLTSMNSALREQHVNRCLDQEESLGSVSEVPSVPSCPLCGKPFNTEKSRASHLKRCAAKLEVPAQTLLQAIQRQNNELGTEVTAGVSRAKRKAGSKQTEPPKKRKPAQPGSEVEALLVAMALSRSMQEDAAAPSIASGTFAVPSRDVTVPAKKRHRKQKNRPPPLLLVQDPQAPLQRLQERMSLLLSEDSESGSISRLPPSRLWDIEGNQTEAWVRPQREGKRCSLWQISNMMENADPFNYYIKELNHLITPWKPPPKLLNSQPQTAARHLPSETSPCTINSTKNRSCDVPCKAAPQPSSSQKDRQALLDLAELAGEGMTLTQWNSAPAGVIGNTGRDSVGSLSSSGFDPSLREASGKPSLKPSVSNAPLVSLAADFMEMVNNPHLSDAQLQTDCGEVLSVHMFVLYARCPLLVEAIHSEGFWVDEASTGRIQRFLLNDVSAEAALSFLRFLYCASSIVPTHCLSHVCELARRFGVNSLIQACERVGDDPQYPSDEGIAEDEDDDGGERAETFQELLKSMWVDEGEVVSDGLPEGGLEEEKADREDVGEGELDEIYEFAATQRRITERQDVDGGSSSEHDIGKLSMESDECPLEVSVQTVPAHRQQWVAEASVHVTARPESSDQVMLAETSPRCLTTDSFEISPARAPLATPVNTTTLSASASQTSRPASSVSRQLFGNSEKPEHVVCARCSPSRLDDSYDRMFSETCGEYAEPAETCASLTHTDRTAHGDGKYPQKSLASPTSLPQIGYSPKSLAYSPNSSAFPPRSQPCNLTVRESPSDSHPHRRISVASPPTSRSPRLPFLPSPNSNHPPSPRSVSSPANSQPCNLSLQESLSHSHPHRRISVSSPPIPRSPRLRFLTSPNSNHPPSPKSVASPANSQPCNLSLQESPSDSHPHRRISVSSPPTPRSPRLPFLTSPSPRSVASPANSQPCSLPSFLSNSPRLHSSPLLASPCHSQPLSVSSRASPLNSQPHSLPSLASPAKSRPANLISSDSSQDSQLGKRQPLPSPSKSQPRTYNSPNHCPARPYTSSPCAKTGDQEIILILSSDEESEPSVKPTEPLHIEQIHETDACGGIKESPISFGERRSTEGLGPLEMSSSTDTSWLVPATPLCHVTVARTSQHQDSRQPLQSPNVSSCSMVPLHDHFVSTTQAKSPVSPLKSTPTSPDTQTTSKIFTSIHNTPGQRKTLSSFGSKGSHVPSSLATSATNTSVFEVGDTDDGSPASKTQSEANDHSFYMDYEPPIHVEDEMWFDREETPQKSISIPKEKTPSPKKDTPLKSNTLLEISPEASRRNESHHTAVSQRSRQSFLDSQLWEEDEGDELPAMLPLSERLSKVPDHHKELKTPVSMMQKRELAPKVPITPLPSYSDMDTPVLKKELNRFGVRALPKKQMVLKLKEIFRYTHQVMSSDSEDEVPSSQVHKQKHSSTSQPPRPARKAVPTGGSKGQNSPQAKKRKKLASACTAQEADEQPLTASQESTASSTAASDTSSLSQRGFQIFKTRNEFRADRVSREMSDGSGTE